MDQSRQELEAEARRLGIQGIGDMSEQELREAVDRANEIKQGQPPGHPPGTTP